MQGKPFRVRRFVNAGMAVLGFAIICAALNAILPFPEIGVVASHLRFFKKQRANYDAVFIGSSLTHHDVSPAVFDRVMAERGHVSRAFNFGVDGMLLAESSFVLERLLASRPPRLKWVFIELDELDARPFRGAGGSRRDVYWRDWKRTSLLLQEVLERHSASDSITFPDQPDQKRSRLSTPELAWFHFKLFAENAGNVSRRIDLAWWGSHFWKPEKMPDDLGPDGDGYLPFGGDFPEAKRLAYQYEVDQAARNVRERLVSPATERACRDIAAQLRKVGATPVFVVMPVISQVKLRFRPGAEPGPVLEFNDMIAYPQFYRTDMRAEEIHLNPKGAEALTTLIAQDLSRLIEENRVPTR